ncbi:MAG: hydantoinase/oxoprolinase family protein [Synergistetes bacterium]|nr:hydantoinase/oxoprolinase family protein [Synergistota bacterium]
MVERENKSLILGLDVGGTHVDAVVLEGKRVIDKVKIPIESDDLFEPIWTALLKLIKDKKDSISQINLSTTVATNAIAQDKLEPVGMIIESGPGVDLSHLTVKGGVFFISGYIDHRGVEIKPFNTNEIFLAKNLFKSKGINLCGVVTKFSVRNPSHEIKIWELLKNDFEFISLGHKLSGKLNFPRRINTTYLNSATYPSFKRFYKGIIEALEKEKIKTQVNILKADGGTVELETAKDYPVYTILSGPAASILGALALGVPKEDGIIIDIGGTTTDIAFVIQGIPMLEPFGIKIGDYNTLVRALYSFSIGLGGDSAIKIIKGKLKIGPEREGFPKALGGPSPTPSDAMITLGLLDLGNKEQAIKSIKDISIILGLDTKSCAELILKEMVGSIKKAVEKALDSINNKPVTTIKELLYGKKISPKFLFLIGGPAKALAPFLKEEFGVPCYVPKLYDVANALGAALAKKTFEINLFINTADEILSVPELGICKKINKSFTFEEAQKLSLSLLREWALSKGMREEEFESEIIESTSFNIVRGFYTCGKNIRIKAQIKPGLLFSLGEIENA